MTADDPAARISRNLGWLAAIGQTAAVVSVAAKLSWGAAESYDPVWPWICLAVLALVTVATLVEVLTARTTRRSTTVYVIVAQAVLVAHLWIWDPARALSMPAFDNTASVGVGLAFLVLPRTRAVVNVGVMQILYVALLPRALGVVWTSWIVATTVLTSMVCLIARIAIDESVAQMMSSQQLSAEVESLEDQTSVRAHALSSWLDIVHREIIGTLLPASRETGVGHDLVRTRAAAALDALSAFRLPESEESFGRFVHKSAAALGLEVDLQQYGEWTDTGPQPALRSSLTEALSNVQRHAGTDSATITARFEPMHWQVVVADTGSGFDAATVSGARSHGLDISLRSPWEAAGGVADVSSTPGVGTTITLGWGSSDPMTAILSPRSLRWLSALIVLSLSLYVVMGWVAGGYHSAIVLALGQIALVLATALAFSRRGRDYLGLGLLFVSQVGLAANIAPYASADIRTWFAGAMTAAIGVRAFRGRWRTSLVVLLASWGAAGWLMAGRTIDFLILGRLLGSYIGPLMGLVFAYVGEILRRVDRTNQTQLSRRAAIQRRAAEVRAGLERWDTENAPLIAFVTPMLSELAAGEPITSSTAHDCKALEACCRDYLRSPGFVDGELLADAFKARRRGCDVLFDVARVPSEPVLGALRHAAHDVLVSSSTVALNITHIDGGPTTVVVKSDPQTLPEVARLISDQFRHLALTSQTPTILDGTLLVELTA